MAAPTPLLTAAQLASLLRSRRKAKGFTQGDVALRMSLSQKRYSELERDVTLLSVRQLMQLAAILDLELFASLREREQGTETSQW